MGGGWIVRLWCRRRDGIENHQPAVATSGAGVIISVGLFAKPKLAMCFLAADPLSAWSIRAVSA